MKPEEDYLEKSLKTITEEYMEYFTMPQDEELTVNKKGQVVRTGERLKLHRKITALKSRVEKYIEKAEMQEKLGVRILQDPEVPVVAQDTYTK